MALLFAATYPERTALVVHGSEDKVVSVEVARYMAERIPSARLVEIPGAGHLAFGEQALRVVAEKERFLTDIWESGGWEEGEPERTLATVLFTDIVGSTAAIVGAVAELGLEIRAGLHTGECEFADGKLAGIALHTGARVALHARPGEVLVSSTVKDLVAGSGIQFEDRGTHELKDVPGEWKLFAVGTVPV